jgi:hypothetical protein
MLSRLLVSKTLSLAFKDSKKGSSVLRDLIDRADYKKNGYQSEAGDAVSDVLGLLAGLYMLYPPGAFDFWYADPVELKEAAVAQTVKLSDELVEDAKRIAAVEHRSVPRQIEFYFRMALIAEENPDLSFSLIREIMKADAEEATEEYSFG